MADHCTPSEPATHSTVYLLGQNTDIHWNHNRLLPEWLMLPWQAFLRWICGELIIFCGETGPHTSTFFVFVSLNSKTYFFPIRFACMRIQSQIHQMLLNCKNLSEIVSFKPDGCHLFMCISATPNKAAFTKMLAKRRTSLCGSNVFLKPNSLWLIWEVVMGWSEWGWTMPVNNNLIS